MALTLTVPGNASDVVGVPGNNKYVIKRIQFDSSYAIGGEALTAITLGLESLHIIICESEDSGYVPQYDYSGEKLALYTAGADNDSGLDEVANAEDMSAVYVRIIAYGR